MESKKINQLATEMAPASTDLTIIGDPITGVSKKVTLLQIADIFSTIGTVTSVGVTETGDALTITGSPITSSGTINIGFAGAASQYVRGDGALADFPTSAGGGSSVSYYLNSSVSQGTIGGVAYRELSKDPIAGAGTDISISANGYIASYITDANDPALLEVPGGNFNCEFYFSVNSNAHNPYVYAELYKYDGTTFTLLGSSQTVPEYLTNGTTLSPYYFAIPVATSALTITDRLAIRIYANVDTKTVTLHTENSHLCQVVTTFSKGLTSLNNLTAQVQYLATGTSGTDFAISSSTATHTFNLPVASATNTGKLSSTDWATFNAKANDSLVVHLAGTETISGTKTFTNSNVFSGANLFTTWSMRFDQGTAIKETANFGSTLGYTTIGGAVNGLALKLSDDGKKTFAFANATTNNTYTFPDATGTVALTSDLTGGTVTSAALSAPTGFSVTGSPVTTTGTLALSFAAGYSLPTDASQATWDSAYTNRITSLTTTGNSGSSTLVSNTLNVPTYTLAGLGGISLTSLSATTPLSYNNTTGAFSIQVANTSQDGYLSSTDWNTFNGKQNTITNPVTGTGTSGQVTYFNGTSSVTGSSSFKFDGTNLTIGNPSSALAQLHIYNASAAASFLLQTNSTTDYSEIAVRNNSSTATSYFRQYSTATTLSDFGVSRAGLAMFFSNYATNFVVGTRNGGDLIFGTNDVERVRILSSNGYVGIGPSMSSPSYQLDVNGTARFSSSVTANYGGTFIIPSESPASGNVALTAKTSNGNNDIFRWYDGTTQLGVFKNSGNVGIGTSSPVANDGTSKTFQIGSRLTIQNVVGTQFLLGTNVYYDGGWKYIAAAKAQAVRGTGESGAIQFSLSPTGTAGGSVPNMDGSDVKMIILESGNVGIGTSSPATTLHALGPIRSQDSRGGSFAAVEISGGSSSLYPYISVDQSNPLTFITGAAERMRITSGGEVLMNTSTTLTAGWLCISVASNNYNAIVLKDTGTSYSAGNYYQVFTNSSNTIVGSISHPTATTISFNTSSDYRLKEDLKDFNGLDILSNIKFYDFKWKNEDIRMHGVIAHELQEVVPLSVSGTKDEINDEGNIAAQGVDYSKLVPIIGKALQEAMAKIKELEARLKTIENK